jgi:hypothetical protein
MTPETFELLVELDFVYDSSCMGDDRPYMEEHQELSLLELPAHWRTDDCRTSAGAWTLAPPDPPTNPRS